MDYSVDVSIATMNFLNNKNLCQKPIAWLLVVTLFLLMLLPIQIHIHHDLDFDSHLGDEHVIDYHVMFGGVDHAFQEESNVLEMSSDFIAKKSTDNLFKVVAFFVLFLLMSLQAFSYYQRRYYSIQFNYQKHYRLNPPLRAPPL